MTENTEPRFPNPYEEPDHVGPDLTRTFRGGWKLVPPKPGENLADGEGETKMFFHLRPGGDLIKVLPDGRRVLLTSLWSGWEVVFPQDGEKSTGDAGEEPTGDATEEAAAGQSE